MAAPVEYGQHSTANRSVVAVQMKEVAVANDSLARQHCLERVVHPLAELAVVLVAVVQNVLQFSQMHEDVYVLEGLLKVVQGLLWMLGVGREPAAAAAKRRLAS